jgi:hypothetical protein
MLRLRRPVILATAASLALAAVVAILLARSTGPDCDTYRFDAGAWRAARAAGPSGEERLKDAATAIAHCGVFTGQPVSAVRDQLGAPALRSPQSWSYSLAAEPESGLAWLNFTLDRSQSRRVIHTSVMPM